MLKEIESILMDDETAKSTIEKSRVKKWMKSDDMETLGAVYELITEKAHYTKITPFLEYLDYKEFLANYLQRCILEDPSHDSDWADTRYTASWAFVNWYKHFYHAQDVEKSERLYWKLWLKDLYNQNDSKIRICIETAILEHLCEDKKIRKYFSDF
ncbi:MAG: hypothetical protein MJK04_05485 [Psychrosphaera sp.]|nr:hypothetical protein [Psychrosphaera sp.]